VGCPEPDRPTPKADAFCPSREGIFKGADTGDKTKSPFEQVVLGQNVASNLLPLRVGSPKAADPSPGLRRGKRGKN